jgi:threonine/homoserine/homoserine lactone efflux protein
MLADAIGKMFPATMAIAMTPIQIVAVIVVLGGPQGRAGGFAFLAGWLAALGALVTVGILLVDKLGESGRTPTPLLHWLQLAAGLLLLVMAIRLWRKRKKTGKEPAMPKWLTSLGEARPARAFMVGVSTAAANPKIIALVLSSTTSLAYLALSAWQLAAVAILFVLLGSMPLIALVVAHAIGGSATASRIADLKEVMLRHNDVILAVVLAMLGASVLGNGLSGLR